MIRLACHPKPNQAARVRLHGTLPSDVASTLHGRELQMVISYGPNSGVLSLVTWEGGEHGVRFRVHAGGTFDVTAPYDHPVTRHLRETLGHEYWGLTDFPPLRLWNSVKLLRPSEVAPYRPKGEHWRTTKSRLERLLEAEHQEWAGTLSRQGLRDLANAIRQELHVEPTGAGPQERAECDCETPGECAEEGCRATRR